ncbi:uncharacterized protein J4E84_002800 [Alternaria hordeiaustralica]|uniref:uncharacterized protein n=1 Tax=Alternaria hordeiaustralica TaxID=1187925 RepID=UPI0020C1D3B2|nr:uncharacterized protein J4E84_002800 [Alternaria hordeiaustralica]KAI4694218.1 hypothetical protein J4E84_002800 [Alternaria hordeiaustralica]
MSGFTEHTIFWLTLSKSQDRCIESGGIYGNSEKQQQLMKAKILGKCNTLTDHDITSEKRLDEELVKWRNKADGYLRYTYANGKDLLFSIEKERDDNEEVAKALQSPQPVDLWAYRRYAMVQDEWDRLMIEGVATPELPVTPERIVLEDPVTLENKVLDPMIRGNGHPSLPFWDDFKSFISKDKAIIHAKVELYKKRSSRWTPTPPPMEGEHGAWFGIVRIECPIKDGDEGENPRYVLARFYTVFPYRQLRDFEGYESESSPKVSKLHTTTELVQSSRKMAVNKDLNPDKDLVYLEVTYTTKIDLIGPYLITDHGLDAARKRLFKLCKLNIEGTNEILLA